MNSDVEEMSESLVRIFENVLLTEEKSLSRGYFSDLSIAEMHTLTAIGDEPDCPVSRHHNRYSYRVHRQTREEGLC